MKDARLTLDSSGAYDLKLDNGEFPWCEEGTQVANHGLIRLRTFRGERLMDENWGTQWYQLVFNAEISQVEKELEIKRQLLSVPGVQYIEEFTLTQSEMEFNLSAIIQTEFGTETFETVVSL